MESNTKSNRPEIRGRVEAIMEPQTFSSGFSKQTVVVETGYKFPNPVKVTFKKDAMRFLEGVAVGDAVSIPYAIDGRRWDGLNGTQYFIDITGMGLTKIAASGGASAPAKPAASAKEAVIAAWKQRNGDDMNALGAFCKNVVPGKASKDYTDADWNAVKAAIENPAAADGEGDLDDLPF